MQRMLSTSDFAAATGISESSVRRLADSGELAIHRTRGGHRRIPVAEALRYVRETGGKLVRPELIGWVESADRVDVQSPATQLFDALQKGHARQVTGVIQSMYSSGTSIAEVCDGPIYDAMLAIGDRWPDDKRSIFIEHRATLLCVQALCQIRMSIPEPTENAPKAIGGAPQDDPYLLPSLMASLVLHASGYAETNLGANTPLDVLTDYVEDERPNLVWLSISTPLRSRQQTREIDLLAKTIESYGGVLFIGGMNAATYNSTFAQTCRTMRELNERAVALAAA